MARTHLAHKAEHAVDLDSGAVVAVTLQAADKGDTATMDETLIEAGMAVAELAVHQSESHFWRYEGQHPRHRRAGCRQGLSERRGPQAGEELRSAQLHSGKAARRASAVGRARPRSNRVVYENRRRVRGDYGKRLLKRRGELVERSFAHCYETGGMRRCHLRGRENILKRQLAHVSAFNLSLVMRQLLGAGTPRELKKQSIRLVLRIFRLPTCKIRPNSTVEPRTPSVLDSTGTYGPSSPDAGPSGIPLLAPRTARACLLTYSFGIKEMLWNPMSPTIEAWEIRGKSVIPAM